MSAEDIRKILNTFNDIDGNKQHLQERRSLLKRSTNPLSEIKMPDIKVPNFFKKKSEPTSNFDEELFKFAQNLSLPSDYDVNQRQDYGRDSDGTMFATVDCYVTEPKYTDTPNGLQMHGDALEKFMQTDFPGTIRIKNESQDVTDDEDSEGTHTDGSPWHKIKVFRHTFECPSRKENNNG